MAQVTESKLIQWYEEVPVCTSSDPLKREIFARSLSDIQIHQAVMENIFESNTNWSDKIVLLMNTIPEKYLIARQLVYWFLSKKITEAEFRIIAAILNLKQRDMMKYLL